METVILVVHVLVSIGLIGLVLLQQGKGADMGAAFGSGASSTVFGSQGSASFLTRGTAILATIFFITSLSLAYFTSGNVSSSSVTDLPGTVMSIEQAPVIDVPADMPATPVQPQAETPEVK